MTENGTSGEDLKRADELKGEGNKHLIAGEYGPAAECYTKAIDLNSHNAVYFANRAQAFIKLEEQGLAIADSTEAIKLNPDYVKAYYRRAVAYFAIFKLKEAQKDLQTVVKKAPGDKDAKKRLEECTKLIKRRAFEKAIEVEDAPLVSDTLDLQSINFDKSYDGVKLETTTEKDQEGKDVTRYIMTKEFIEDMIKRFKDDKRIPLRYAFAIVLESLRIFRQESTLVEIPDLSNDVITVCGDTHGQFYDLLNIFKINGEPSPNHMYLFNGDFVDRGSWSCEVALLLCSYKLLYPKQFFINRGNHETEDMNKVYGFEGECTSKYNQKLYKVFSELFMALPLGTLIGNAYLVVHGGLFSNDKVTLDDIRKLNRLGQRQVGQSGIMMEMLWTDPQTEPGRGPSKRGVGLQFGPDVTKRFCEANHLKAVIRSHEMCMEGYEVAHDGRLITVFSAPNYCDMQHNKGAFINIDKSLKLNYKQFDAVPHPDVKPMAYASNMLC